MMTFEIYCGKYNKNFEDLARIEEDNIAQPTLDNLLLHLLPTLVLRLTLLYRRGGQEIQIVVLLWNCKFQ